MTLRVRWRSALLLAMLAPAIALGQSLSSLRVVVSDGESQPVPDAVVVAVPTDPSLLLDARTRAESVDQVDKEFVPKVKPVFVGSTVAFPNRDNVRHHVYSFSAAKRFELPLYSGVPARPVLFDKPGVVVLGCNIHDWMIGYIYVSESPFYAKTDARGRATIADLPARTFIVRVWHPQMTGSEADTRREVKLAPGEHADITFALALAPEERVRRAPGVEHGSHY